MRWKKGDKGKLTDCGYSNGIAVVIRIDYNNGVYKADEINGNRRFKICASQFIKEGELR